MYLGPDDQTPLAQHSFPILDQLLHLGRCADGIDDERIVVLHLVDELPFCFRFTRLSQFSAAYQSDKLRPSSTKVSGGPLGCSAQHVGWIMK